MSITHSHSVISVAWIYTESNVPWPGHFKQQFCNLHQVRPTAGQYPCSSSTAHTDFLIAPLMETQYTASALNTVIVASFPGPAQLSVACRAWERGYCYRSLLENTILNSCAFTVVNFAPAHTGFQPFPGWETLLWPNISPVQSPKSNFYNNPPVRQRGHRILHYKFTRYLRKIYSRLW